MRKIVCVLFEKNLILRVIYGSILYIINLFFEKKKAPCTLLIQKHGGKDFKMTKKVLAVILGIVIVISIFACQSKSQVLYGGDAVCYSYCVYGDRYQLATIPLISNKKIKTAALTNYECPEKDVFLLTQESLDLEECFEYKGYFVYFLGLRIQAADTDRVINSSIDSISVNVNGQEQTMRTPHFKVTNGIEGVDPAFYDDGTLLFGGESTSLVSSFMPTSERPARIGLVSSHDVVLNKFGLMDYFTLSRLEVNSTAANPEELDVALGKDELAVFSYDMQYSNGSDSRCIVRTARYVIFTDAGQKKAFIDGAGAYVYLGYQDQTVIKNYIDSLS